MSMSSAPPISLLLSYTAKAINPYCHEIHIQEKKGLGECGTPNPKPSWMLSSSPPAATQLASCLESSKACLSPPSSHTSLALLHHHSPRFMHQDLETDCRLSPPSGQVLLSAHSCKHYHRLTTFSDSGQMAPTLRIPHGQAIHRSSR